MLERTINLPTRQHFFLFGARGTGKTTLLKKEFIHQNCLRIDLLQSKPYTDFSLDPGLLRKQMQARPDCRRVVIDEVQRVPALLDEVHALIEDYSDLQFILTGSSARKLKRGGANLLAGRAQVHYLHPFTAEELKANFSLDEALQWGTLPRLLRLDNRDDRIEFLRAYATTYLREEVLQEQLIRKLEPFQRFLPIAAQMSGKVLNYASISRDVGVAPATVENYFHILSDTLIGYFLPSFHPSIRKQERAAPKFFLFDTGAMRALAGHLEAGIQKGTSYYGELFEHFIVQEIVKRSSYKRRDDSFSYYQAESGLEIDLIISRPTEQDIFLEIKSTDRVTEQHVTNLNRIAENFPDALMYCFSQDGNLKQLGKTRCIHWKEGLREIGL